MKMSFLTHLGSDIVPCGFCHFLMIMAIGLVLSDVTALVISSASLTLNN